MTRPHPARHRRILPAILATVLMIGACAVPDAPGADTAGDAVAAPDDTASVTPPATPPIAAPTSPTWLPGRRPFTDADLAGADMEDWPDLLVDRPVPAGTGPLAVDATLTRSPDPCTLWVRQVADVDLGDGAAADRMATELRAVLAAPDHVPALLGAGDAPWCTDRGPDGLAFLATEVWEEPCALPEGPLLRCITVATLRYDGGAHPNTWHDILVFDATTGGRLDLDAAAGAAGTDAADLAALVDGLVCDLDRAEGLLDRTQDCWDTVPRAFVPSTAGLTLSFAAYEAAPYVVGPRDLFLPWDVVADGAPVPAAVLAAQRALLRAVRSGDWDEVSALLPADGAFRAGFGNPEDPIAYYRSLPRDPREEWITILTQPAGRVLDIPVWPELYAREVFVITADERAELEAAYGAESIRGWEAAGMYLGWRAGFDPDGTWRFMVAGD